jgi:fibronectin type 3 domain-containing protein
MMAYYRLNNIKRRSRMQRLLLFTAIFLALCVGRSAFAVSGPGDVVGKVTVGYQGWFACTGDGSPMNNWWHWSANWGQPPATNNVAIKAWPDVREFAAVYPTAFSNLNNGQPAALFSSYDQQTVNTHAAWLQQNGIDTIALQRFNPNGGEVNRDGMAAKVRSAAETYGRKFYIMYDSSGWTTMQTEIKADWTNKMSALTASPAYARQNGKPVVCVWGLCMNDTTHPFSPAVCLDVINWFKSQGCYLIGGVRRDWRTADATYLDAYHAMDMISPWLIGAVGSVSDADNIYNNFMIADQADCNANGVDYQPCVLPGDVSIPGQRSHGNLMWRMFYNATRVGCQGIYISMFDEYNEGNQIAKTTETLSTVPAGSGFQSLNEDGTACSSDYYLRLTGDGGRMFKGLTALTSSRPTVPMPPVVSASAPTSLLARSANAAAVLTWTGIVGPADISSYNVKRSTVSNGPYTTIATNVGHVSYTDTGLANNTTYYYVVSAVNSLGESADSAEAVVIPLVSYAINSGGSAVGSFVADAYYSGGNAGSTGAAIDLSAVTNPAPQAVYQTERWGANTYTFSSLTPAANYKVRLHFAEIFYNAPGIRAFNVFINGTQVLFNYDIFAEAGKNKAVIKEFIVAANGSGQIVIQYANIPGKDNAKSSGIEILPVNNTPLTAPTGLVAAAVSPTEIGLTWTASAAVASYNVKRASTVGGPYTNIAIGITALAYDDAGLAPNSSYYYEVSAVNNGTESSASAPAAAATPALPPPTTPIAVTATSVGTEIRLNWLLAGWVTGYNIKYSTNSGGPYTLVASNVTGGCYTNTGLTPGKIYYFVVSSINATAESANSAEVSARAGLLSRTGWVASASSSNAPDPPANAIDGNINSRWSTGANQVPGQWFQVDMGSTNILSAIVLDCGASTGDYPRGYQLYLSKDGTNWGTPIAVGNGSAVTTISFDAHAARYIRVTQTGSASANWWSIAEFNAYLAAPIPLSLASSNNGLTLTWPTNAAVAPYYTTSLTPPITWMPVTNAPTIVNGQWNLTVSVGLNQSGFYRLQY